MLSIDKKIHELMLAGVLALFLIVTFTFGIHVILNIGRYLGTIARYATLGNVCNL
jgi:hypothetical protein